ncbi:MAG: mannose-1-phosphate guanylyltransferase/mannose-6-phosphate isomerase [Fretibacterium sp.]|nr:mannose-1-phosphate guanylyltransferase/mannose-6-phosphate isomerase [Fretibacterium sp.]
MPDLYGLILTGGSGTRLWPRSREDLPKQFLALYGTRTLLQDTMARMLNVVPVERLFSVTGTQWEALVTHQAREAAVSRVGGPAERLPEGFAVQEPCARNTAPAILLGVEAVREAGAADDDIVIVTPSDHIVRDPRAFAEALRTATQAAAEGFLTTLGVVPDRPETGFGYIRRGRPRSLAQGETIPPDPPHGEWFEAEAFVEKPDLPTAEAYLKSGKYFWNSGVFIFSLRTLEAELARTAPELRSLMGNGTHALREAFRDIKPVSFDVAIMERAHRVAVVPLDAGWSDVGSWDALHDLLEQDEQGNTAMGDVVLRNSGNCLVDSRGRLAVLNGVTDLVVVDSPDALFITRRGTSQEVRDVVKALKEEGRREVIHISESSRPWGGYRVLCEDARHRVRRVTVMQGRTLPVQSFHHSNEHWILLQGTGRLTLGDQTRFIHEGEGVFIPKDTPHGLENCGHIDLEFIAIQEGEFLGEDEL